MKKDYCEILEHHLSQRGTISHQYAEKLLKVSPSTIRRLFREMAESHKAFRYHGGLSALAHGTDDIVVPIPQREALETSEKELLAQQALPELDVSTINMIHGGTTTQRMARYLLKGTYLTDSVLLAAELSKLYPNGNGPEVLLTGGMLDMKAGFLYGPKAEDTIKSYCGAVFVTSVFGMDRQGLLETDDHTVGIMRAMMKACRRTVVIADHRKFNRLGNCRLADWKQVDLLITTECQENKTEIEYLKQTGIKIITIPGNQQ